MLCITLSSLAKVFNTIRTHTPQSLPGSPPTSAPPLLTHTGCLSFPRTRGAYFSPRPSILILFLCPERPSLRSSRDHSLWFKSWLRCHLPREAFLITQADTELPTPTRCSLFPLKHLVTSSFPLCSRFVLFCPSSYL